MRRCLQAAREGRRAGPGRPPGPGGAGAGGNLRPGAWRVGRARFRKVRRPLQSAGHEVFTPSLTGIGERADLASPQVCLTTHIADVANAVLYEDLRASCCWGSPTAGWDHRGARAHRRPGQPPGVPDALVPADGDSPTPSAGPPAGPPRSGPAPTGWCRRCRGLRRPSRGQLVSGPPHRASRPVLQRTGPARPPAGELPVHPDLHQGVRRAPRRASRAVLGRCGPGQELAGLALPRSRHHPHDPQQPPGRPGQPADRTRGRASLTRQPRRPGRAAVRSRAGRRGTSGRCRPGR